MLNRKKEMQKVEIKEERESHSSSKQIRAERQNNQPYAIVLHIKQVFQSPNRRVFSQVDISVGPRNPMHVRSTVNYIKINWLTPNLHRIAALLRLGPLQSII